MVVALLAFGVLFAQPLGASPVRAPSSPDPAVEPSTAAAPAATADTDFASPTDTTALASAALAARPAPRTMAPAPPSTPVSAPVLDPPSDLRRVSDWLAYQTARHLTSLPAEARLFYRRGLIAWQSGQREEALVNVRGAAELDPSFVDPHLTLAAWMLTSEPSQALQQYAVVVELLRQDFNLQLGLAANAFLVGFQAFYVGLLLACLFLVGLRRHELIHAWRERLARFAPRMGAGWWATAVFALPFLAGFGLTLPTLGYSAYLWPNLRARERVLTLLLLVTALGTPLALNLIERFSLTLNDQAGPLYDVPQIGGAAHSVAREERYASLIQHQPDNAILQFGLAWTARRGGHLARAEAAYQQVLRLRPRDDRAINNLGNVQAMQGRTDEALASYRRATEANPANAGAYFNSAQLHTQRFEYQAATEDLSHASALNFELVRSYQAQGTTDGLLPLIDEWLTPDVFWQALRTTPLPAASAGGVPLGLRGHVEASGWGFSVAAVLVAVIGFMGGLWQHRRLHLRLCNNCEGIVCRRCAERRREQALCPDCADIEARAETPEFGRVLLQRHRHDRQRRRQLVQTALAALIPGFGLLAHRRTFTAVFLLGATWLLAFLWTGAPPPLALEPRLTLPGQELPSVLLYGAIALIYILSFLAYLHHSEKARAREAALQGGMRGRVTQSTRRVLHTAA